MANKKDNKVEQAVNSVETKTKPLSEKAAEKEALKAAKREKKEARKAAKEAQKNAAKKEGKEKLGFFAKIAKFFRDYRSEFKKLVWPSPQQLAKNSAVVLVSIVVCGAALWAIDFLLGDLLLPGIYNLFWEIPGMTDFFG
ncbi:MAG: preprotein translocase subunit SecE [Clostridia bacterium]|nr:preprotein translocase subunit SecE [Clostridia bacterium]